ncbi:hypothetical protein [Bdellovibrio bacteriovorus]|uniref:Uncharacterized protein n=1 Tax=Bdellovibrio bacteriovorus TaxID=959 RepID=A0A1Z3N9Z8_BDEBC|nr:hypothetical protein [Bdellovibrio bacteriovorus]ASD64303.1 hypothetical protein B9G79_12365 [Bdellovibrio bacteriovorus]
MKVQNFNKVLVMAIVVAAAPFAQASSLTGSELNSVRGVLRAMNIDESQLSNEEIEALRQRGSEIRSYEKSKADLLEDAKDGSIYRTCGAGSHGGSGDPV